jgi:hypothetical protein
MIVTIQSTEKEEFYDSNPEGFSLLPMPYKL